LICVSALFVTGCGSDASTSTATTQVPQGASGEATIFAAASLTEAFTRLGDEFMAGNPEATLTFSFASSSDLAGQITQGGPADVYASADTANMAKVTDAGAATGEPVVFATNRAEIIVEPGNPLGIEGVADLAVDDLVLVICAPEVPCGAYARTIFDNAGVVVTPDSLEQNVKAVVSKVTLGEADAGIVYATDVQAAGDSASGVRIPDDINVTAEYPIVAVSDDPVAQAFIDFVTGPDGKRILTSFGFGAP
jgi:molybdate transport system substrate-binding protein